MSYSCIGNFGQTEKPSLMSNPLSYCAVSGLDAGFYHTLGGSYLKPESSQCQQFMASYCSSKWDNICETLSKDSTKTSPNTVQQCNGQMGIINTGLGGDLTRGQILIRNAAAERFLKGMSDNCKRNYEPFDPTVADSPLISKWNAQGNSCGSGRNCHASNVCIPVYGVDASTIDNDEIMNKILEQPWIAMNILVNIYNNAIRNGEIQKLENTKLGMFFKRSDFQKIVQERIFTV
jgi:hypothetical protein